MDAAAGNGLVDVPLLSYGRAPARRLAGEQVRTIRHGSSVTVAVFPRGLRRSDFVSVLAGVLTVAATLTAVTAWFVTHPAPLARYAGAVWPLAAVLLFFLGLLAVAHDDARRQVEFEADGDELTRTSFGPFGVRRQAWRRSAIRDVRVEAHVSGSHPRVVLVTRDGRRLDALWPGAAHALRGHAEDVARHLRAALASE